MCTKCGVFLMLNEAARMFTSVLYEIYNCVYNETFTIMKMLGRSINTLPEAI
jgi:hypothetical protein